MKLDARQKRSLRRLWKGDSSTEEILAEMEFTLDQLEQAKAILGLPPRPEPEFFLPTQAEIRLECAKIRAGWHPSEREARLGKINIPTKGENYARRSEAGDRPHRGSPNHNERRRSR